MTGLQLAADEARQPVVRVTCPNCKKEDAPVEVVNVGRVLAGTEGSEILQCRGCNWRWQITFSLRPCPRDPDSHAHRHKVSAC